MEAFEQIRNGSVAAQEVSGDIEDALWLVPIEDRQRQGSLRKGIVKGFTLGQSTARVGKQVGCSASSEHRLTARFVNAAPNNIS